MHTWNDSMKENGRVFTEKYVALPDHSEHQTGLAIDLAPVSYTHLCREIDSSKQGQI